MRFGTKFAYGNSDGALSYTINDLEKNTTYYFKIRGGNGCMPGEWSNTVAVKTVSSNTVSYYKNVFTQVRDTFPRTVTNAGSGQVQGVSSTCLYTVLPGDSLWNIARETTGDGMQFGELMELNGLHSTLLHIGVRLKTRCL